MFSLVYCNRLGTHHFTRMLPVEGNSHSSAAIGQTHGIASYSCGGRGMESVLLLNGLMCPYWYRGVKARHDGGGVAVVVNGIVATVIFKLWF